MPTNTEILEHANEIIEWGRELRRLIVTRIKGKSELEALGVSEGARNEVAASRDEAIREHWTARPEIRGEPDAGRG